MGHPQRKSTPATRKDTDYTKQKPRSSKAQHSEDKNGHGINGIMRNHFSTMFSANEETVQGSQTQEKEVQKLGKTGQSATSMDKDLMKLANHRPRTELLRIARLGAQQGMGFAWRRSVCGRLWPGKEQHEAVTSPSMKLPVAQSANS